MKIDKNKITSYKYFKKDSEIGTNIFQTDNYYVIGKQEKVSIYSINVYFANAAKNITIYPDPSINIDLINNEIDENGWFTITLPQQSLGSGGMQGGYFLSFDESHLSKLKIKYSYHDSLYIKLDYMYFYTGGTSVQQLSDVDSVLTNLTFTIVCGDSDKIYFSDDVYVKGDVIVETLDNANINLKTSNNTEINLGSSNKSNIYINSLNNSSIIINNQIKKDSNINIKQPFDCANLNKIKGKQENEYAISFGTKADPIDRNHLYVIKIVDAAGTFILGSIFFFDEDLYNGIKTANNIYTNSDNSQYIVMIKALANGIPTTDWSNADGLYIYVAYINHLDMYMDSDHLAVQISNLKLSHAKSYIMQVPMNFNINNYGLE